MHRYKYRYRVPLPPRISDYEKSDPDPYPPKYLEGETDSNPIIMSQVASQFINEELEKRRRLKPKQQQNGE